MAKADRKFGYTATGAQGAPAPIHRDDNSRHHYRTEIPNLVDEMELSVYAFRLYARLKRVAGDSGQCWESTRTLADACKMSVGQVCKAKQELSDAKLIRLERREHKKTDLVSIEDVWRLNFARFGGANHAANNVHDMNTKRGECSPHEHDVHDMNVNVHDTESKKNSLIRTNEERESGVLPKKIPAEKEELDLHLQIMDELSREIAAYSPAHEMLKGCCLIRVSDRVFELYVLHAKDTEWLNQQLAGQIRKKLSTLVGKRVDLEILTYSHE